MLVRKSLIQGNQQKYKSWVNRVVSKVLAFIIFKLSNDRSGPGMVVYTCIPAFRRLGKADCHEFKISLGCTVLRKSELQTDKQKQHKTHNGANKKAQQVKPLAS